MHRESLVDTLPVTHSHCNESSEVMSKGQKTYSKVDCVLRTQSILGESPIWDPHEKVLFWVDIEAHDIHRFHPESGVNDTFHLPQIVSSVGLRQQGGLIVTLKDNFAFSILTPGSWTFWAGQIWTCRRVASTMASVTGRGVFGLGP